MPLTFNPAAIRIGIIGLGSVDLHPIPVIRSAAKDLTPPKPDAPW